MSAASNPIIRNKRCNFGWETEFRLPNGWTLAGHSEGRSATGFILVELRIFLDAGMVCRKWKPHAILLTHAHQDHCNALPCLLTGSGDRRIIVCLPRPILDGVYAYVAASKLQKLPREERKANMLCPSETQRDDRTFEDALAIWAPLDAGDALSLHVPTLRTNLVRPVTIHPYDRNVKTLTESKDAAADTNEDETDESSAPSNKSVGGRDDCQDITIRAVQCVHSTADIGYIIHQTRYKLRPEFVGTEPKAMAALRKKGIELTQPVSVPQLAYICDTSVAVFATPETAIAILSCPVVMIECNFLETEMEQEALERGHMCATQLIPIIVLHPQTLFILFHFSQRYRTDAEIKAFFVAQCAHSPLNNVRLWMSGEVACVQRE